MTPPIRMETDLIDSAEPERIMCFSMWFLASVATFGMAFFPMFYFLIERRNQHFRRQREMEGRASILSTDYEISVHADKNPPLQRNGTLWTVSIILIFPAFVLLYVLSKDLALHEKNQHTFLSREFPDANYKPQRIATKVCVFLTLATLGVGGAYWLYRVFDMYNNHFREHRVIDNEIIAFMEARSHGESV